jgi:ABC-type uncharacterized transport system involved in gliding motility auxiliary subunit
MISSSSRPLDRGLDTIFGRTPVMEATFLDPSANRSRALPGMPPPTASIAFPHRPSDGANDERDINVVVQIDVNKYAVHKSPTSGSGSPARNGHIME